MINSINTENHSDTLQDKIETINSELYNGELKDIIEVTYKYSKKNANGNYINETLFEKFTGETFNNNIEELYDKALNKLELKKALTLKHLNSLDKNTQNPKEKVLIGSLEYMKDILIIAINGLVFEAEKGGMKTNLSKEEAMVIVRQNEEIEAKLFGPKATKNPFEIIESVKYLKKQLSKNKYKLTPEEYAKFENYISKIYNSPETNIENKSNNNEFALKSVSESNDKDFLKKEIHRDDYVRIFKLAFEIYNIDVPVIVENRGDIYDDADALRVPNSKKYKYLSIEKIFKYLAHEIETHYVIAKNNEKVLGKARGGNNLFREEGLAKAAEGILKGTDINDLYGITLSIPQILMGEILEGEDFFEYLKINHKLGGKDPEDRFLRRKRNYPLWYKGVQHKDTSYSRGLNNVIEYINSGKDLKELFYAKSSFKDIGNIKEIVDNENIKIQFPILLGELLKFALSNGKNNKGNFKKVFWDKIYKKYNFINVKEEFLNGRVKELTMEQRMKVARILEILKKEPKPKKTDIEKTD